MQRYTLTASLAVLIIFALANGAGAQATNSGVIGIASGQTSRDPASAPDPRRHPTDPTKVSFPSERSATAASRNAAFQALAQRPFSFERNVGQFAPTIQFESRGTGYSLALSDNEAVLSLATGDARKDLARPDAPTVTATALRMSLVGANQNAVITGVDPLSDKVNYLMGNDPKRWKLHVPHYARVKYEGVYPGIDLVYYGNQGQLEYDLVVAPGADPSQIRLSFDGTKSLSLDPATGDLVVTLANGAELRQRRPVIYQMADRKKENIAGSYRILDQKDATFALASYDPRKSLVIDPTLDFTNIFGGIGINYPQGIAVDDEGNAYVTGYTVSDDFPQIPGSVFGGAFRGVLGSAQCTVATGTATGAGAVPAGTLTWVSGTQFNPNWAGLQITFGGILYVIASIKSATVLTLTTGLEGGTGGNEWSVNICNTPFVTKISPHGEILFSSYFGGTAADKPTEAFGIAADSTGVFITGDTHATDFLTNAKYARHVGSAYVADLDPSGESFGWVVGLGGTVTAAPGVESLLNVGTAIALDARHNAHIAGYTNATDFPTTEDFEGKHKSWQPVYGASTCPPDGGVQCQNGFVAELPATGNFDDGGYSTYIGGSLSDEVAAIAVNGAGVAFVTGTTFSPDFPAQPSSAGGIPAGSPPAGGGQGGQTAFVTSLLADGSGVVYSYFLGGYGGTPFDTGYGIAVDSADKAYVTGATCSPNFPTTPGAVDVVQYVKCSELDGTGLNVNGFVSAFSPAGALTYSTLIGGPGTVGQTTAYTYGVTIALNSAGEVYVGGLTSADWLLGSGNLNTLHNSGSTGFVIKFAPDLSSFGFVTYIGANVAGVSVQTPCAGITCFIHSLLTTYVYATGGTFLPGADVSVPNNTKSFVSKWSDSPVLMRAPPLSAF